METTVTTSLNLFLHHQLEIHQDGNHRYHLLNLFLHHQLEIHLMIMDLETTEVMEGMEVMVVMEVVVVMEEYHHQVYQHTPDVDEAFGGSDREYKSVLESAHEGVWKINYRDGNTRRYIALDEQDGERYWKVMLMGNLASKLEYASRHIKDRYRTYFKAMNDKLTRTWNGMQEGLNKRTKT
jgi:hypothetical protein